MFSDNQGDSIFSDVRWSLLAALGSLCLLLTVLFLCAKKEKGSKGKRKGSEERNGSMRPASQEQEQKPYPDIYPTIGPVENSGGQMNVYSFQDSQKKRASANHPNNNGNGSEQSHPQQHQQPQQQQQQQQPLGGSFDVVNEVPMKQNDIPRKKSSKKSRDGKTKKQKKDDKGSAGKKSNRNRSPESQNKTNPPGSVASIDIAIENPAKRAPLPSEFMNLPLPSCQINVADLDAWLREAQKTGEIQKQYKEIPRSMGFQTDDSVRPEQREKNRYRNIVPYDYNRVQLSIINNDPNSHYINASLIENYGAKKQYIASQGPIEPTIKDFWRMIWEHKVSVIVMVTNPWERGMKCMTYWPEGEKKQEEFGDIEVSLEKTDVQMLPDYTKRKITVRKGDEQRQVTQFQFRTWPDHGVPRHAMALLNFRDTVRRTIKNVETPILIHCSAGVGRTGTFLAIDYLLDQAQEEGFIDVPDCVCKFRKQRSDLVQTVEQYGFIYQAVLEYLVLGQTTIACHELDKVCEKLKKENKEGKTRLQQQFEMLDQFMAPKPEMRDLVALEDGNRAKNRSSKVIPIDEIRRVKLLTQLDGHTNYINAVFADGYRVTGAFITTEMTLPNTKVDFWRMVHEYKCSIIVMLNPVKNSQEADLYFPVGVGEKLQIPPVDIECLEKKESNGLEMRTLRFIYEKEKKEIFHLAVSSELSMNAEDLFETTRALHEKVTRRQLSHKDPSIGQHTRPVVVHCLNGTEWTGLFVVMSHLFDQINSDQEVDIFNAARQSRHARPQFIATQEQYMMLHEVVKLYIDSFDIYSNFK